MGEETIRWAEVPAQEDPELERRLGWRKARKPGLDTRLTPHAAATNSWSPPVTPTPSAFDVAGGTWDAKSNERRAYAGRKMSSCVSHTILGGMCGRSRPSGPLHSAVLRDYLVSGSP